MRGNKRKIFFIYILFAVKFSDKVWVLLIWTNELILETVIYFFSTPRLKKIVPEVSSKDAISCLRKVQTVRG